MDFGAVSDPGRVDFSLPVPTADSRRVLAAGRTNTGPGWLRVGAPVWSRRDFVGSLYPPGTSPRDYLRVYAQALGAVELNATFYAVPAPAVVEGWVRATPETFRFCPKVPRSISHEDGLHGDRAQAAFAAFCGALAPLGPRLGPLLLQLPPAFGPTRLPALDAFLASATPTVRIAVELRDEGWFDFGALMPEAARVLERHRATAVITDAAGRRDVCHGSFTTPQAFVRYAGSSLHEADGRRLDAWAARLDALRAAGLEDAYFFVHQPDDALAPATLALFAEKARALGLPVPAVSVRHRAAQLDLF